MPGMTTMPMLQSAPPANSNANLFSPAVTPASVPDAQILPVPSGDPGPAANASTADTASGVEARDVADSFADVLQRQLAQASPVNALVPNFAPLPDPTPAIQAISATAMVLSPAPISVESLLADLSNFVARPSSPGITQGPAIPGPAIPGLFNTENPQNLPRTVASLAVEPKDLPTPVEGREIGPKDLPLSVEISEKVLPTPPIAVPAAGDLLKSEPTAQTTGDKKGDDGPQEMRFDGLTSLAPFIPSSAPGEVVKTTVGAPLDEKKVAAATTAALMLPTPVPASITVGSDTGREAAPTAEPEVPRKPPEESAEIAVTQTTLADVPSQDASRNESIAPTTSFESLLAAAQAVVQHRTGGAHASNSPSAQLPVDTPVGSRGWDGEVADKLVWLVGRQEQRAELVLNPPQMGRIEVSLSMSDGQTSALFVSANPAVRDALEAALPRLREILAEAGVSLGQTQVGADTGNNAGNSSTNNAENRDNSGRGLSNDDLASGNEILRQLDAPQWLKRGNGLVDIFA